MQSIPNAVSVAIFSGGEVLLIQRARPPYQGFWTLPGGRLEAGETPEAAALREIEEELGLTLEPLIPVSEAPAGGAFILAVFAARLKTGQPHPSDEIASWCWTRPDSVQVAPVTPGLVPILARALLLLGNP